MITKIILENFMAHEHTELELGVGVNALTGPNNTGKSAIVEGLRCVATNPVPKHYIRHGAKEARVTVEVEDGTRVVWVRKKRSPGYELWAPGAEEPVEFWKLGRGKVPDEVRDVLRLDLVKLETGAEVDVHVGNQRDPIFLLNQPGSNAAAFFAASTESAHLLAMQNLLKRKTQDSKRIERDLKGRLGEIEEQLADFSPLPDLHLMAEKGRELEKTTARLKAEIPALESLIQAERTTADSLSRLDETVTILNAAQKTPEVNDTSDLSSIMGNLQMLESTLTTTEKRAFSLQPLSALPDVFETRSLSRMCEAMVQTESELKRAAVLSEAAQSLSTPPLQENTTQLSVLLNQIYESRIRSQRAQRWNDVLQNVAEPPLLTPLQDLEIALGEMRSAGQAVEAAKQQLRGLEDRLNSLKSDIEKAVDAIGACPTCGAELDSSRLLDLGGKSDA